MTSPATQHYETSESPERAFGVIPFKTAGSASLPLAGFGRARRRIYLAVAMVASLAIQIHAGEWLNPPPEKPTRHQFGGTWFVAAAVSAAGAVVLGRAANKKQSEADAILSVGAIESLLVNQDRGRGIALQRQARDLRDISTVFLSASVGFLAGGIVSLEFGRRTAITATVRYGGDK